MIPDLKEHSSREPFLHTAKITLKDPYRVLHRATNHWSSVVRFCTLHKLETTVPAETPFAKDSLLPALIEALDPNRSKQSKLETRQIARMSAHLLRLIGVPEDKEEEVGEKISKAFANSQDIKTKVSLTVAAIQLNYLTVDMLAFVHNCKKEDLNEYPGEMGVLLSTNGKEEKKGLSLIYDAIFHEKKGVEGIAQSYIGKTEILWDAVQTSYDRKVFTAALKLLECLVRDENRDRFCEILYKRGSDDSTHWSRLQQQAAIAYLRNAPKVLTSRHEIHINELSRRLFSRPIDLFCHEETVEAVNSFISVADLVFCKLFELAIDNYLNKENLPLIKRLCRECPIQAQLADLKQYERLVNEKNDLEAKILPYEGGLNRATIDSFDDKFRRLANFWDSLSVDFFSGLNNLIGVDPDFRKRLKKFLDKR